MQFVFNKICLFLDVHVLVSLLLFFLLPLLDSMAAETQVFSVELQLIFSDSDIEAYFVVMLSSQSCFSYYLLLQKLFYDRLREAFSSSRTLKL